MINQTDKSLTDALINLSPALEQLAAAGSNLPKALQVAGTFPFPLGKTLNAVKGDYANLHLFLDLNLTDELCGLNAAPTPHSAAARRQSCPRPDQGDVVERSGVQPADATNRYQPTLLGLGG